MIWFLVDAGIAILTTVLTVRTHFHLNVMGTAMQAGPATQEFIGGLSHQAVQAGYSHGAAMGISRGYLAMHVGQTAAVAGFEDAFIFGAVIILIAVLPALLLPKKIVIHKDQHAAITVSE